MEYNKLTQKLLSEGYTVDNYPKEVRLPGGVYGKNPLENIYGGFEYWRYYSDEFVYKTGCGKHVKGINVIDNMGYKIEWSHENDNPVIRCPYDKAECELNNPLLHGEHGSSLCFQCWCECHRTDETYNYETSIEKAKKEREDDRQRRYQEYSDKHHGRVCRNHMYFTEKSREWKLKYEPYNCVKDCHSVFCPIRQKEIDKKKGNVFYDMKTCVTRQDGTLFDGEKIINITKGIRFFERPVSMDICNDFIKLQSEEIYRKHYWNHGTTMKMINKTYEFEILNIRAESRPSRDLMQDLQDIQDGITIIHESDREKRQKEKKKQCREDAQQKKIKKLEKKILEVGYPNLHKGSIDKVHADKWLGGARIAQLEAERKKKLKQAQEKPKQMQLSDFIATS